LNLSIKKSESHLQEVSEEMAFCLLLAMINFDNFFLCLQGRRQFRHGTAVLHESFVRVRAEAARSARAQKV
jgi:hypothetical protein